MRTSPPGTPGLDEVKVLSRSLGRCMRGTEQDVLTGLGAAAGSLQDTDPAHSRRIAAAALVWAMIRQLDRSANIVLLYGQITRHLQLEAVSEWLTDWLVEMVGSPLDPAADSMRTSELYLHLAMSGLPESSWLTPTASALSRFHPAS